MVELHVLVPGQKPALLKDMSKFARKKCCGMKDFKFGVVFLKRDPGTIVNGYTIECQVCGKTTARVFEHEDGLKLVDISMENGVVIQDDPDE